MAQDGQAIKSPQTTLMSERRAAEKAKREANNLKRSQDKIAIKELQSG